MPIKPENKKLYPKDWPEIRERILARANNCCEFCGVENRVQGYRSEDGTFINVDLSSYVGPKAKKEAEEAFKITLTVAHLDHDPTNNNPANLRALCQRCHNQYDAQHRAMNARATRRARRAHKELF